MPNRDIEETSAFTLVNERSERDRKQAVDTPITPFTILNSSGTIETKIVSKTVPNTNSMANYSKEQIAYENGDVDKMPFDDDISPIKGIPSHNFYLHKYISTAQKRADGSPCGYVYNPALGVPERGILPGTDIALIDPNTKVAPGGDRAYWFVPYQEPNMIYVNDIMYAPEDVIQTPFTDEPEISEVLKNTVLIEQTAPPQSETAPKTIFESIDPGTDNIKTGKPEIPADKTEIGEKVSKKTVNTLLVLVVIYFSYQYFMKK